MSTFPLLRLPLIVQQVVIGQIELSQLMMLTITSTKFKSHLEFLRLKIHQIECHFSKSNFQLKIKRGNDDNVTLEANRWPFTRVSKNEVQVAENLKNDIDNQVVGDTSRNKAKVVESLFKFLLDFARPQEYSLKITEPVRLIKFFLWKFTRQFDSIQVTPTSIEEIYISSKTAVFILEELETKSLQLDVKIADAPLFKYKFSPEKTYKHQKLIVTSSNWIKIDSLIDSNIEEIECRLFGILYEFHVSIILNQWIAGKNGNLRKMKLMKEGYEKIMKKDLMENVKNEASVYGIKQLRQFVKDEHKRVSPISYLFDIRRRSDGLRATIAASRCTLWMIVWNETNLSQLEL
ncbi:hypothetical protein CAEBREN_19249 [Caenorhabditis brenneri]|uniref:F-box domain-containing protein n=1 Tax=Caenorhabditis brenneri TaxID=135651 RepID=G0P1X3_CAEBE|nr:hypothetical protein CAEBREN_19249 [Caenorhabditis brenneri]